MAHTDSSVQRGHEVLPHLPQDLSLKVVVTAGFVGWLACVLVAIDLSKSSWTRFLPKILTNLPEIFPRIEGLGTRLPLASCTHSFATLSWNIYTVSNDHCMCACAANNTRGLKKAQNGCSYAYSSAREHIGSYLEGTGRSFARRGKPSLRIVNEVIVPRGPH